MTTPPAANTTIQERFDAFDAAHPEVWQEFARLAFLLLAKHQSGKIKWVSAKAIWERMRSNFLFEGDGDGSGYKLNNIFTSRYARKLIEAHPEFNGILQTRELQAK